MDTIQNKLFTCSQTADSVWEVNFRERSSDEQVEVCDYFHLFKLKNAAAGQRFCITGRNTVVAYFAAGYYLTLWGAREISVRMPGPQYYTLLEETKASPENKPWLAVSGPSRLSVVPNPSAADGKWEQEILQQLKTPVLFPDVCNNDAPVTVTGKGSVLMYAALGIAFARSFPKKTVKLQLPILPYEVCFHEETINKEPLKGDKNGIVIGILGDPNSGKSVFSRSFYHALKNCLPSWADIWLYDCDMASPTPDWYLNNAEKDSQESQIRQHIKTKWTSTLEQKVARDLNGMRTKLDILIADMPGGRHPKEDENWPAQRIADENRAAMMEACDAYIVLCRGGEDKIYDEWQKALENYGLQDRIIARFNTFLRPEEERSFTMANVSCDEKGLFHTDLYDLDRKIPKETIIGGMTAACRMLMEYISYIPVARQARAATVQAFLTGNRGTRYGAAVRIASTGEMMSAGQYSSFNHATNIHAEMNVLAQAAAAGKPDVEVLAVACSSSELAAPCGVCRQVMLEHAMRIGHDFHVLLVPASGWFRMMKVSDLLPLSWRSLTVPVGKKSAKKINEEIFCEKKCFSGSFYLDKSKGGLKTVNMVWDPCFTPDQGITKIKYHLDDGLLHKTPHAFSEAAFYQKYLIDNKLNNENFPNLLLFRSHQDKCFVSPLRLTPDLIHTENADKIYDFLRERLFAPAGIDISKQVFLTCSRMLQIHSDSSDYDLVVYACSTQISKLRETVLQLLEEGAITLTAESGSIKLLSDIFRRNCNIYAEGRYCETFSLGAHKFSLMFAHQEELQTDTPCYAFDSTPRFSGRGMISGYVINADNAPYKRSESFILTEAREMVRLLCYHKVGNLLKEGDHIAASGNFYTVAGRDERTLVLSSFSTDKIVWFS